MAKRIPFPDRIWLKIDKSGPDGCWLWFGTRAENGYGRVWVGRNTCAIHRVVYELLVGPIPEGLELDHLCRVRHCVNPTHLEPVTHQENMLRSSRLITHCPQGHEYTPENTKRMAARPTVRYCKACQADEQRRRRAKKKAARPPLQRDVDRHGTRSRYERRGCRCDECRAANATAARERHRAKRALSHES